MDSKQIAAELHQHHQAFIDFVNSFSQEEAEFSALNKWSALQHFDHIRRAVRPLRLAFWLPLWVLRRWQGTPNRTGRSYEALVQRYHEKLAAGGAASGPFVPPATTIDKRKVIGKALLRDVRFLCKQIDKLKESDLDAYLLPHPLLGKLTLREMLYFTIYHVQHHQRIVAGYSDSAIRLAA